jgi:hypothetical protein
MLTFLYGEYRDMVMRRYKLRLAAIHLGLLTIVFLIGTALSIPVYVLLESKLSATKLEQGTPIVAGEKPDTIQNEVAAIKEKLSLISKDNSEIPLTSVIEKLLSKKTEDIIFYSISLKRNAEMGTITIGGIASTRDALVAFSKRLQGEPSFSGVNLPVGSLTKSKDVPFNIAIDSKI